MTLSLSLGALGWALLHSFWQLALVGLGAALLLKAAGPGRLRAQYLIAYGALVLCLVLPVLTFLHGMVPGAAPVVAGPSGVAAFTSAVPGAPPLATPARWVDRITGLLAGNVGRIAALWILGALAMALRMGGGWLATLRWRREAVAVPAPWAATFAALARNLGAGGRVILLASTRVATPVALGLWRPVVLVPAALFTRMPEAYLEALLAHELAHVARLDFLFNLLQSVIEVLCFHHPVVWWLSRRVRTLRELLCDGMAAKAIGEPRRLALALDALDDVRPHLTPMALAARGGPLFERIHHLVNPAPTPGCASWALAPVLALLLPCAALALKAEAPEAFPIAIKPELVAQVDALARQEGLDPQLLRSVAWAESGFNAKAKSSMGALGLLQVMPETARKYGAKDLGDPDQVAASGARYLKFLLARYSGDVAKAVTAYNCGENALDAGKAGPEAVQYQALVLDVLQAKAVQPAPALPEGGVDGTIRLVGDGTVCLLKARASTRTGMVMELFPETPGGGPDPKPMGTLTIGDGGKSTGEAWLVNEPTLRMEVPPHRFFRIRVSDPGLGISGETSFTVPGTWKTFSFTMKPKA